MTVRVRGIYATALTQLLHDEGVAIIQPSASIADRFSLDEEAERPKGYDAALATTDDRSGVGVSGNPETVSTIRECLSALDIDAFAWSDDAPREAVFDGVVTDARRGGAVVDLGLREGYLPFDAVENRVEKGDHYRVQVTEPAPPWSDDRPLLGTAIRVRGGGLLELVREGDSRAARPESGGGSGSSGSNRRGTTGIGGVIDLLPTAVPENWRARPTKRADDASFDALDAALADAVTRAEGIDTALVTAGDPGEPLDDDGDGSGTSRRRVWADTETAWVRFGRGARFALDDVRRDVTATMPGHHRIKASTENASAAVDFAESVCGSLAGTSGADAGDDSDDAGDSDFPFVATTRHFGPREGEKVAIRHGKPDGREIVLGRGEVSSIASDGSLVLRREMRSAGTYDAIGTERREGDVAITRFVEGRWWYQTRYRSADGEPRGTYVNVCTPLELFPDAVRYVDLYVDVVKRPDEEVERVDDAELDAAIDEGVVGEELATKARSVAGAIESAL